MSGRDADATRTATPDGDGDLPYLVDADGCRIGGPSDAELAHAAETRLRRDMQAAIARCQNGDQTAFAEAVYLYWKQHPRQFPHELVEASEALVKREAFMVRSSRSPAPPA
jgi:hypothetical protein